MAASVLKAFHPALARWFAGSFGTPTDVQVQAWSSILDGSHTLIAAPTGSGKTLAALLPCIHRAVERREAGGSGREGVAIIYVTPLKALNNDIHHHVVRFVEEIDRTAAETGLHWPGLTAAVRTGDTTAAQRAAMLRRPPDVLITTPESLYILLTSAKGRRVLRTAEAVIVDEIHDLAADKRGSHLSLSLERLAALCGRPVQRIGVSATQKPLERVARFLGGWAPREMGTAPTDAAGQGSAVAETGAAGQGSAVAETDMAGRGSAVAETDAAGQGSAVAETDAASQGSAVAETDAAGRGSAVTDADATGPGSAVGRNGGGTAEIPGPGGGEPGGLHPLGYAPRPVAIVESGIQKRFDILVTVPDFSKPAQTREAVWYPLMDRILQLMEGARSVLIFVNSRRLCERLCLRLNEYVGYELARAHHGSMSRETRLEVEGLLKAGELRALVATSSLELGIDVGHVDLVIQIDSPLEAAAGIQRIGRAGHAVGDASRGVLIARTRGILPELAVLGKLIAERDIEPIEVPRNALDVLSQQLVAAVATDDWQAEELYRLVVGSDSYRSMPRERFESTLLVLAGFFPFARPLLNWDRQAGLLTRRANTAMAAYTGAGTIPQSSAYPVHHLDSRVHLGELDEEFIHESRVGDVFQLGTSSWMIREIKKDRVYVSEAGNRFSEVPFWRNEAGGRSAGLGEQLGVFLEELTARIEASESGSGSGSESDGDTAIVEWLEQDYHLDQSAASALIGYIRSQAAACAVPTHSRIVVEHFRDVTNQTHVILHNQWGRRVNRTWQLAIERRFASFLPHRLYGSARDNGIEFVLPDWDPSWLQAVWGVTPANVEQLLQEAIPGSPMLAIAFRRIAETSLLLSRSFTRTPMWQKRLRSEELLRHAVPFAEEFPHLHEAMRESLYSYLDLSRLRELLADLAEGRIEIVVRETEQPSPMAAQFTFDYVNTRLYEGEGVDDTIRLQLMNVSKELAGELFGQDAVRRAIDPAVEAGERERLERLERPPSDADGLYRLLKQRGDLAASELERLAGGTAADWMRELHTAGQVMPFPFGSSGERWICSDEAELYEAFPRTSASIALVAGRYAEHVLSFTDMELVERYPQLTEKEARMVTDELLRLGLIEQAPFAVDPGERLWSGKRIASRVVRLSIQQARKQTEPVEPDRWASRMAYLQHALQGAQLRGTDGLRAVIGKLQGYFLPLALWESVVLPSRVADYRKDELDLLCASGEILWIGRRAEGEKEGRIAFFLAEDRALYAPYLARSAAAEHESAHPELLARLKRGGASFLTRLSRETGQLPSETLADLMDLVWEGRVSNDQFAPLRVFARGRGKMGLGKTGSGQGRWYALASLDERDDLDEGDSEARTGAAAGAASAGAASGAAASEQSAVKWVHHLLDSCGIVTKELVESASPYRWDQLLPVIRRLEEWGVLTRGMFIEGSASMQFAARDQLDAVRRPLPASAGADVTILSAADPANPFGLVADWPQEPGIGYARKSGNYLVLRDGRWVMWIENGGRRIHMREPLPEDPGLLKPILKTILQRQGLSKIKIELWNGEEAVNSGAERLLRAWGAERDRSAMVFWPSAL